MSNSNSRPAFTDRRWIEVLREVELNGWLKCSPSHCLTMTSCEFVPIGNDCGSISWVCLPYNTIRAILLISLEIDRSVGSGLHRGVLLNALAFFLQGLTSLLTWVVSSMLSLLPHQGGVLPQLSHALLPILTVSLQGIIQLLPKNTVSPSLHRVKVHLLVQIYLMFLMGKLQLLPLPSELHFP